MARLAIWQITLQKNGGAGAATGVVPRPAAQGTPAATVVYSFVIWIVVLEEQVDRLTVYQLPRYSPEFNPIEFLWRNIKKQATHLRYFPKFEDLTKKVDENLEYFANLPESTLGLMGRYCKTLGAETA